MVDNNKGGIHDVRREFITKLYGPERRMLQERCKDFCTKDGVKDAFFNGHDSSSKSEWISSTKYAHKGYKDGFKIRTPCGEKSHQNTNFILGFDKPRYDCTMAGDFKWHRNAEKRQLKTADNTVHIPEFCPSLLEHKNTLGSVYHTSFTVDPSQPRPMPRPYKERKKHSNDLRETHFKLGSWSNVNTSETNHALGFEKSLENDNTKFHKSNERHLSKVFREGDWNRIDRKMIGESVTQNSFAPPARNGKMCVYQDEFTESGYHQATHFDLGKINRANVSLYEKDFAEKPLSFAFHRNKLMNAERNKKSDLEYLFSEEPKQCLTSTKDSSFKSYGTDHLLGLKQERQTAVKQLKQRLTQDSLQPDQIHSINKSLSMSCSDFRAPPLVHNKYNLDVPKYNHLDGYYDGDDAKTSEAHEKYKVHKNTSKQVRHECHERRRENKSTHFVFGTNCSDEPRSEQALQFRSHLLLDPNLRAAGKEMPHNKQYAHIFQNKDTLATPYTSVMTKDFQSPNTRTSEDVLYGKGRPSVFSQYADTSTLLHTGDELTRRHNSTTTRDFISPLDQLFKKHQNLSNLMYSK